MRIENAVRSIETLLKDATRSVLREKLLEHIFVAELLQEAWVQGIDVSVLRAEADVWGYDLVLKTADIVRFVQLKSGAQGRSITVSRSLESTVGACVVRLDPEEDRTARRIRLQYRFAGGTPDTPMDLSDAPVAKRNTLNRAGIKPQRVNHVKLGPARFDGPMTMTELVRRLFPPTEGSR